MPLNIEIFSSPGCSKCGHAKAVLQTIVDEMGTENATWRAVNILDEIDYAVSLQILSTPSIAIDGRVVFTTLPSPKKLKLAIEKAISKNEGTD